MSCLYLEKITLDLVLRIRKSEMIESMKGVFQGEKEAWAKALKGRETYPNWEILKQRVNQRL